MPKIEQELIKSICFIYPSENDAIQGSEYVGTAFLMGRIKENNKQECFCITNKHVIEDCTIPCLRVNKIDGNYQLIKTNKDDWVYHPYGDDLAICSFYLGEKSFDVLYVQSDFIITKSFIDQKNVGVGDDVFMLGRFRVHSGTKRVLPTAMFGCIAQMPREPLYHPLFNLPQESFLVEMKSISGFSGSPVFIHIPAFTNRFDGNPNVSGEWFVRLLGVSWGQIPYKLVAEDEEKRKNYIKIDSAIAGVVPAWKILDIIDNE